MIHLVVTIDGLKVVSEMNLREHWAKRAKRTKTQRTIVTTYLNHCGNKVRRELMESPELLVRFTRISGKRMDTDNLCTAFKHVRDAVAAWLKRDDNPDSGIEWELPPQQETGSPGIRIEIIQNEVKT